MSKFKPSLQSTLNIGFWIIMYLFWLGFNQPAMPGLKVNLFFTLVDFLCFISISLITTKVLIPKFLYKKKYLLFIVLYGLTLFVITTFMAYCNFLILRNTGQFRPFTLNLKDIAGSYLLAFFLCSVSSIFKLVHDFYRNQEMITKLREEKLKTELEFLKLQVNPHSFFNILNTIYFQIDLDKEKAKDCVLHFSSMYRYQLYECESEKVYLSKEIEFLDNYIKISKSRFDSDYSIDFRVTRNGNPQIAPFLLFPLVENSFKHVSQHINQQNTIEISITYDQDNLECFICNTSDTHLTNTEGIGLKNLKRRLELLYKDRYFYTSMWNNGKYNTNLKLQL